MLKVVETFSGIGSQAKALKNIGIDYEITCTADWDINAMIAYDLIHHGKQDLSVYRNMTKQDLIQSLSKYTLSLDGKKPATEKNMQDLSEDVLKRVLCAIRRSNNLVSITDIKAKDLPNRIDLLTYSFPCQDLSLAGNWHGNKSGIEEMQKPFDEIISQEVEEQEILVGQNTPITPTGVDKTKDDEPKTGGEDEGEDPRTRDGKNKPSGNGENTTGGGGSYHEIKMKYVKTPYDSDNNRYRVIIRPVEDIEKSEIHFLRCTDSGELEKINVKKAIINGNELEISGNAVKNIELRENEDTRIDIEFDAKRKCIMEVRVYVQD